MALKTIVLTAVRYYYACPRCGQCAWLRSATDRADSMNVHSRECGGRVRIWVEQREKHAALKDIDLNDTHGCPSGGTCSICGTEDDVTTETAGTRLGVFCLRVCGTCADGPLPAFSSAVEAAERVMEHCEHLGISGDDMAAVLEHEEREGYR
jgi:transcription elongation factor Elf1